MSVPSSTFCFFFFLLLIVNTEIFFLRFFFVSSAYFLVVFFFFFSPFVLLLIVPQCRGGYAMVSTCISLLLSCFGCTRFFFFLTPSLVFFFSYRSFVSRARDDDDDNDNDVQVNWPLLFR